MSKVHAPKSCFTPIREDATATIVSYEFQADGKKNGFWQEVSIWKKKRMKPSLQEVKDAVIADIDAQTDLKILNGYQFTPDGQEEAVTVWLSKESQTNFSEAHRLQVVPVKFKLNEDADKNAIYHTFETFEELDRFYKGGVAWIQQCLNEGWARKDAIDWAPYEAYFPITTNAE